jgi:hypothetical protein
MATPRVLFGIVCDDVRREDNGKLVLIGVYGGSILVPSFPATVVLSLVLAVDVSNAPVDVNAKFQVLLGDQKILGGTGQIRAIGNGRHLFQIKNLLIEAPQAGLLTFQLSQDGGAWETACEYPFNLQAKTAPST